jgi:hypothetical protein
MAIVDGDKAIQIMLIRLLEQIFGQLANQRPFSLPLGLGEHGCKKQHNGIYIILCVMSELHGDPSFCWKIV